MGNRKRKGGNPQNDANPKWDILPRGILTFASRTASEGTIEYGRRLERGAEEIFFPHKEEEAGERRHCLKVKRQLNNYQRYSQALPNKNPHAHEENKRPPLRRREGNQEESSLTRPDRPGNHEDYLEGWYRKVMKMTRVCIITPHPEGVKLDMLKNNPMQFPNKKWPGENDMEQFWKWYTELLGFLAS